MAHEEYTARANIRRFEELLRKPRDEAECRTIEGLLAEEREKLRRLTQSPERPLPAASLNPEGLARDGRDPV